MKVKIWFEGGDVTHYDIVDNIYIDGDYLVLEHIKENRHQWYGYYWPAVIDMWVGSEDAVPHHCIEGD